MDLDEDAEVKIPEPQAQPGEKEAGSQRQEGPAPATQREGSTPEVAPGGGPRDASETSLWGSGPGMWRWEVSAGAGGGGEGLVQSEGWRNRSVWRPRSVCGGAGEMHRAARVTVSQDGGGEGQRAMAPLTAVQARGSWERAGIVCEEQQAAAPTRAPGTPLWASEFQSQQEECPGEAWVGVSRRPRGRRSAVGSGKRVGRRGGCLHLLKH